MRICLLTLLSVTTCQCFIIETALSWLTLSNLSPFVALGGVYKYIAYKLDKTPETCQIEKNFEYRLKEYLDNNVFGQHIATPYIYNALRAHVADKDPERALSQIFMGTTGVGKNHVANMIGESLFGANAAKYVHYFSGRAHFPDANKAAEYREKLLEEIKNHVKACPKSIFVFDEIDKMPSGVIDVIRPYLDIYPSYDGVDYRKAIFIFITNFGGKEITRTYYNIRNRGLVRREVRYEDFERFLRQELHASDQGMFGGSDLLRDHMIGFYVPFLPLEEEHVKKCVEREMRRYNIPRVREDDVVASVFGKLDFFEGMSLTGCKRVQDFVRIYKYM